MLEVFAPVLQVYVAAPLARRVTDSPMQISWSLTEIIMVGLGMNVTETVDEDLQFMELDPQTVYMPPEGIAVKLCVLMPLLQV